MNADAVRVVIDLDLTGPLVSRHLYGHFAEHLGRCVYGGFWVGEDSPIPNIRGLRRDVIGALRALNIPNLRWPGGCFADEYHWRDGIGPRRQRPRMVNSTWGDVVEDNSFGTHEFMDLCELLEAEPFVNGNVGSGTVREMKDWVEYLTRSDDAPMANLRRANGRQAPWQVPFWGVGNEGWGCAGHLRPEAFADRACRYATYVHDHGGNQICRIAAGGINADYAWTEALMKALSANQFSAGGPGPYQAISIYRSVHDSELFRDRGDALDFDTDAYYRTMVQARRTEELIARHSTIMDRHDPDRRVGLVLCEWSTWWQVQPGTNPGFLFQQNSLRDALAAAVIFDGFHRQAGRLTMANLAQTINVLQAVLHTDPETGALVKTPTYHVFEMNKGHQDGSALAATIVGGPSRRVGDHELPLVSASATAKADSALVSLSNLAPDAGQAIVLDLRGRAVKGFAGRCLTAPRLQDHNTAARPAVVAPRPLGSVSRHARGLSLELPPQSFATIELDLGD